MPDICLVVTDLDGTLLDGDERIAPAALDAVREVMASPDVDLLIATGRRFSSSHRALATYDILPPAVLMAGAVGADLGSGKQWHRVPLPADLAHQALAVLRDHDLEPVVYVGDAKIDAVAATDCSSNPRHVAQFGAALTRTSPQDVIDAGRCVGFGICGVEHDGLDAAAAALSGVAQAWLGPDHLYGGRTLMVSPLGVTKVSGLEAWCGPRGIAPEQVLAIGDGSNDVAMLGWAGMAVAVAGGVTVDDPHDAVIPSPSEGGWAQIPQLLR